MRSLAVQRSYRGHQEYVACQHSRHISNERLMDVFLRRHQSGRIKHLQESHSRQVPAREVSNSNKALQRPLLLFTKKRT